MATTTETGHSKNISNFQRLMGFCIGYGTTYNPVKAQLKLAALNTLLESANDALQAVKTTKTAFNNATNAREIVFKPLKTLSTKIVNALAAIDTIEQTIDDVKTINNKIQGKRAVPIKKSAPKTDASVAQTIRTVSASQQSYDKMIDHFAQLVETLTAEAKYEPNEEELKVDALNTLLTDLKEKNAVVITATTNASNARIARDKTLYADEFGLCDVAKDVKKYIKSVFKAESPQFKQVSGLSFKVIKED